MSRAISQLAVLSNGLRRHRGVRGRRLMTLALEEGERGMRARVGVLLRTVCRGRSVLQRLARGSEHTRLLWSFGMRG